MQLMRLPMACFALLFAAASWLAFSSAASAGTFQVSPTLAEVAPGSGVASFTIRNQNATPLTVQVDAFAWTQGEAGDAHTPATDLVIVPRIVTVAPGQSQLIRVGLRSPERTAEQAYRVHFVELPPPPEPGFIGVRTAVRFDIPLFFLGPASAPRIDWSAALAADGALQLRADNQAGRYQRLGTLRIVDSRGALLAEREGPLYVLGGQAVAWQLTTHARLAPGDEVVLQVEQDRQVDEFPLQIR